MNDHIIDDIQLNDDSQYLTLQRNSVKIINCLQISIILGNIKPYRGCNIYFRAAFRVDIFGRLLQLQLSKADTMAINHC